MAQVSRVHDGFATIRNGRSARHSVSVSYLEPVSEEPAVKFRLHPDIPWWEVATRRSRHKSFSVIEAHVVSAFEQSLSNMTQRLQQLTATTEEKDTQLHQLRQTIDRLSRQSAESGVTSAGSMSPSLARRHTINTTGGSTISRQLSTDSVSSLNSLSSANSTQQSDSEKKKKRGWLRSSFSKAFTRPKKSRSGSASDAEANDTSVPSSPLLNTPHLMNGDANQQAVKLSHSSSALCDRGSQDIVDELRRQLREKDLVLTDIRLEALSSAHQLESLKDTVINMRNEMLNLKQDNERLQRIVGSKSLASSQSSLPLSDLTDAPLTDTLIDPILCENEGKKVMVTVYLGAHGSYNKYVEEGCDISIGFVPVGSKTKWDSLDAAVKRCFKDYLEKLDPGSSLGLGVDSVWSYHVGEVTRYKENTAPELLPCGYLVGDTSSIPICLKGAFHNSAIDALAFQTLIPKPIIQRYVSLLTEHRRIILCGPSGTGKSYLASKLADFLVLRLGKDSSTGAVATINVEHKSNKELRGWLCSIAETCETEMLPSVIVLDNLHHANDSLAELFNGFTTTKYPYIIGTISQATTSTTDLQLHHNFRWILCVNHMEPVKGLLGRILRRKLVDIETRSGRKNTELSRVVEWLPRVWHHLNQFLETHCSSDVTIGPRVFVGCPLESGSAQAWFTDVWNYSVLPYLQDMVREGLQLYGKRAPWHDPASFVIHTFPWPSDPSALQRLTPEDVGYDTYSGNATKSSNSDNDADPLLNMLMRLQEAANYSNPLNNDSESNSPGVESVL